MNHGELKCVGSPIFLKNRFGTGYQLNLLGDEKIKKESILNFMKSFIFN